MKPESFVCIAPSPTIPLGSIAEKTEEGGYYNIKNIGMTLTWYQVEKNPECWRKVDGKYPCRICNVTFCYHNSPPEEREALGIKVKINDKMQPGEWGLVDEKGKPMYHSMPELAEQSTALSPDFTLEKKLAEQKRQESIEREIAVIMDKYKTRPKDDEWYIASLHCALHELAQYFKIPN